MAEKKFQSPKMSNQYVTSMQYVNYNQGTERNTISLQIHIINVFIRIKTKPVSDVKLCRRLSVNVSAADERPRWIYSPAASERALVFEGSTATSSTYEIFEQTAVSLPEGSGLSHLGQVVYTELEAELLQVLNKRERI